MNVSEERMVRKSRSSGITGSLDICPYLRLRDDEFTAAAYTRPDHCCTLLNRAPVSEGWQSQYCLKANHVNCPYFRNRFRAQSSAPRRSGGVLPGSLRNWRTAIVAGVILLTIIGSTVMAIQGRDLARTNIDAGTDSAATVTPDDVASASEPTETPDVTQTPAQAATPVPTPVPTATPEPEDEDEMTWNGAGDVTFAADLVEALWSRTDRPVADGLVARNWVWGPNPITETILEQWDDAPEGERVVQYFEHGRMEITQDPGEEDGDPLTLGLLVRELVDEQVQYGLNSFAERAGPAEIPIFGDPGESNVPTYADIRRLGLEGPETGTPVDEVITSSIVDDAVVFDDRFAAYDVIASQEEPLTGHVVASVFWEYMNAEGPVFQDDEVLEDALFSYPYEVVGLPITGAFWAMSIEDGQAVDVLWQCFERRCLIYVPEREPGQQVYSSATGRHYLEWRYGGD